MKKAPPRYDLHIVPREEKAAHNYEGVDCECEPRCILLERGLRVFLHAVHRSAVLRCPPPEPQLPADETLLPPGPSEGIV